ncbi:MAG: hypothetical protein M0P91_04545 [Sulfuricurvum sp.]|jgi:hypothetical protein|uniref:hypothetical protein n=1 Tax=Sulfuricurvum sp. TaxID=2025608 RepID=UPI0025E03796|nr:hypothetical protein [Sulfuricurvum sp.]MCK9372444.1 hypothetical protein [Sulfuricurvum sp.]
MSWYKYDNKSMNVSDKIKFYSACVGISVIVSLGVVLAPFLYSHDYLLSKAKEDAHKALMGLNSPKTEYTTEYSFVDVKPLYDNCFYIISVSKYDNSAGYVISDSCKE